MKIVYRIVEHDGGWAYKVGDVFSETFETHNDAKAAAEAAAQHQRITGETLDIEYETPDGKWHEEVASGQDRPATEVQDIDPDQPS